MLDSNVPPHSELPFIVYNETGRRKDEELLFTNPMEFDDLL